MHTITLDECKDIMDEKYGWVRKMVVIDTDGKNKILYLSGSPPKGYVLTGNGIVSFYDLNGERYERLYNTLIVEG